MAQVTVRVATRLDLIADAKAMSYASSNPKAEDFLPDEGGGASRSNGEFAECEGPPAGPVSFEIDVPSVPVPMSTRTSHSVSVEKLQQLAFLDNKNVGPAMKGFRTAFDNGIGLGLKPRPREDVNMSDFTLGNTGSHFCDNALGLQKDVFAYKKAAGLPLVSAGVPVSVAAPLELLACPPEVGPVKRVRLECGPRDRLAHLLGQLKKDPESPMEFDSDQLSFLALVVGQMERMPASYEDGATLKQQALLILGQGGSGETELLRIVRKLVRHFSGEDTYLAMAYTNTAARGVGGDTIHSMCGLYGKTHMTTDRLAAKITQEAKDRWRPVRAMVIDEIPSRPPDLFGGAPFRVCLLRGADQNKYPLRGSAFGGIQLLLLLPFVSIGEFLQLNPMVNIKDQCSRVSLLQEPATDAPVQFRDGYKCFQN